ncbi:unnamed protein product [Vitrella brassicaformis CCMP3155]|uniref:Uncharacterized protein n=2 Tax=Vitrella brassicaformis TaxID=1169539 RepID=A0A0G4GBG0_VITBC|nr:unnamed protein product [Vitrella brassicaformis CCMP3155]|eukprot:CEM26306.1 unnamed protein product [Vitrella brassicaformis CCMP3155]
MSNLSDKLNSEAFWQDFMRRPEAQEALRQEQQQHLQQYAASVKESLVKEKEELKEALLDCGEELRRMLAPIVKYDMVHRLLYNTLTDCNKHGISLNDRLLEDHPFRERLQQLSDECKANPEHLKAIQDQWSEVVFDAKRAEDEEKAKYTTPLIPAQQDLISEALRGHDKPVSKRRLDAYTLKTHLTTAQQMRKDGNEKYQAGDYEKALERYTNAVGLLSPITGSNPNDTKLLNELYILVLKNQAAAALKCERWNTAIAAATDALSIDEYDCKSRYRRAQGRAMLGDIDGARQDYQAIIDEPWVDRDSKEAAKKGLRDLDKIQRNHKKSFNNFWAKTLDKGVFSKERAKDGEAPDAETDTSDAGATRSDGTPPPPLTRKQTLEVLEALRNDYARSDTQDKLRVLAEEVELDEEAFMARLKDALPPLSHSQFAWAQDTYSKADRDLRRDLDTSVTYWRVSDPSVSNLNSAIWQLIMQELMIKKRSKQMEGWEDY